MTPRNFGQMNEIGRQAALEPDLLPPLGDPDEAPFTTSFTVEVLKSGTECRCWAIDDPIDGISVSPHICTVECSDC